MEISRRELGIHVLVHPVVGDRVLHAHRGRPPGGRLRRARGGDPRRARAGARGGRGLAADARAHAGADRRADAGGHGRGGVRGGAGAARVGRRPSLHVPRLPRVRAHRDRAEGGRGLRARAAARAAASQSIGLREAAAGRARAGARARSAGAGQGQQPLADPPARVPGLHRRQEVRRRAQRDRRAALPRALHDAAPTARCRRTSRCCGARRRRCATAPGSRPGSHDDKAIVETIDTFPRDELFQIDVDDLYRIATGILELGERQRVRLFMRTDRYERFVSCLVFLPRDRFNTANRIKIGEILQEALGRGDRRLGAAADRVGAGAHALHAAAAAGDAAGVRRGRARGEDRRGDALVGRRPARGAARGARRGSRDGRLPRVRERVPARVPRRPAGALGGRGRAADGGPGRRGGAGPVAVPAAGGAAGRAALQGLPARRAGVVERRAADVRVARADGDRRAALPRDAARGRAGVAVRLRAAGARAGRRRRDPRALPRGLRARVARRGRAGRLQRADHRRRAGLARGDDAAGGRALPAPGRDPVQRPLHGGHAARASGRGGVAGRAVQGALRSRLERRRRGRGGGSRSRRRSTRSSRSIRTGSCAAS